MSTLALTSNTLAVTATSGQIEYNGQFFATDSNASRGQLERITQGTAVASTSGTSIDFTGIPAWAKKITVMFNGVSGSGTSPFLIQTGAGSVVSSGYVGFNTLFGTAPSITITSYTAGFGLYAATSAATLAFTGQFILTNLTGNTWVATGIFNRGDTVATVNVSGSISLGGTLDRLRITTVNGTDTFDAGSINIMYEG
jgi:hypothetical protein